MKKYFSTAMLLATILFASCGNDEDSTPTGKEENPAIAVTGITLDEPTTNIIESGNSITLTATVKPEDATNKAVTWSATPEEVATVDSKGVVTGHKSGTATITVKTVDGEKTAEFTIKVMTLYAVGDLYPDAANPKGVVFWLDEAVKVGEKSSKGKVLSLDEVSLVWDNRAPYDIVKTNATDPDNGAANMTSIKAIANWKSIFPAASWCDSHGDGWYLPAVNEVEAFYKVRVSLKAALETAEGTVIPGTDYASDVYGVYWSSTEKNALVSTVTYTEYKGSISFFTDTFGKSQSHTARAVLAF